MVGDGYGFDTDTWCIVDRSYPRRGREVMEVRTSTSSHVTWEDEGVAEQLRERVFDAYVCRSVDRGKPHPSEVFEPSTLADASLPTCDYPLWDALPAPIVEQGKLSQLQLEGVLYACNKHRERLPDGTRAGFLIGDGAGVGKGRQVAGIILDNYVRGRTRHLWLSTSTDLYVDAKRDMGDIGLHIKVINGCKELDREWRATGLSADFKEGVMFCTYSTLVSDNGKKKRLDQVVEWLGGETFDGCIVFDECHKAKNYATGGDGGGTKVSKVVVALQEQMPNARVVYCSATSVSEITHMGYLSRLALWGPGTAFQDFPTFREAMKSRGLGFLEMLSVELKSQGKYVVRGLSYTGAEFMEVECPMARQQEETWDSAVHLWNELRRDIETALDITAARTMDVWKMYWGTQQRFFRLLCVSLKIPTVVAETKLALETGHAVVIGLQTTGESSADALKLRSGDECGFISTAKEILLRFIKTHFPTFINADTGVLHTAEFSGRQSQECLDLRRKLMQKASALDLPVNFLDELIDLLGGKDKVAEMTGRKGRIVRVNNRIRYETRADGNTALEDVNLAEKATFMRGKKLIAIISDAASTGISLHADRNAQNQRRRVHLTVELPWSADKAVQQLGRSHRSNQESAPIYKLVSTMVGGEKRFVASVASRLQSLGALTKGDRRAASGLNMAESSFDTKLGRQAVRLLFDYIEHTSDVLPPGVSLEGLCNDASYAPRSVLELHSWLKETMSDLGLSSDLTDLKRFLNRILGLPIQKQNLLFNYFYQLLQEQIRVAKKNGKYSEGVSDLPGSHIRRCGQQTQLWKLAFRNDIIIDRGVSFESALGKLEQVEDPVASGFYQSKRPLYGKTAYLLAIRKPGMHHLYTICRPNTGINYFEMDHAELMGKYAPITAECVRDGWQEAYSSAVDQCLHGPRCGNGPQCTVGRRLTHVSLITGTVCAIWGALEAVLSRHEYELSKADRSLRVVRAEMDDGETLIGIRYPSHLLNEVQELLQAEQAGKCSFANMTALGGRSPYGSTSFVDGKVEMPGTVISKLLSKAFRPPRTLLTYFQPAAAQQIKHPGVETEEKKRAKQEPRKEDIKKHCTSPGMPVIHIIDD